MPRRLRFPVLALLFTLLAAGCSGGGEQLPEAPQLLNRSADAMAAVRTARFDLDVQGTEKPPTVPWLSLIHISEPTRPY